VAFSNITIDASEWNLGLRSSVESYETSNANFFPESTPYNRQAVFDIANEIKGFKSELAIHKKWQENVDEELDTEAIIVEAFYDGSTEHFDYTIGKKVLGWGVGFAHQPLNVLTPVNNLATGIVIEEGALILSVEKYTDSGSISFLVSNTKTQQDSFTKEATGGGFRYYTLKNDWDLQGIIYHDDIYATMLGASAVNALGSSLTIHTSALWMENYDRLINRVSPETPFPAGNPIETLQASGAVQALVGLTYSFNSNISLIAEYWYDERSPTIDEWEKLIETSYIQAETNPGSVYLSAERQFFTSTNLMRKNIMLYLSYEKSSKNVSLDYQFSPEDKGRIGTFRFNHSWGNGYQWQIGYRTYQGPDSAVYNQLPNSREFFFNFEGKL